MVKIVKFDLSKVKKGIHFGRKENLFIVYTSMILYTMQRQK